MTSILLAVQTYHCGSDPVPATLKAVHSSEWLAVKRCSRRLIPDALTSQIWPGGSTAGPPEELICPKQEVVGVRCHDAICRVDLRTNCRLFHLDYGPSLIEILGALHQIVYRGLTTRGVAYVLKEI